MTEEPSNDKIDVNVKMTESTYARLVNEAAVAGCSLSQLVTERLASDSAARRALRDAALEIASALESLRYAAPEAQELHLARIQESVDEMLAESDRVVLPENPKEGE